MSELKKLKVSFEMFISRTNGQHRFNVAEWRFPSNIRPG